MPNNNKVESSPSLIDLGKNFEAEMASAKKIRRRNNYYYFMLEIKDELKSGSKFLLMKEIAQLAGPRCMGAAVRHWRTPTTTKEFERRSFLNCSKVWIHHR